MASIRKYEARSGAITWKVLFRIETATRSETFATRRDAERFVKLVDAVGGARAREVLNEAAPTHALDYSLEDVATKWLKWKSATRPDGTPLRVGSTYTTDRYGQLLRNQVLPRLGHMPINLVTESDVQAWVDALSETFAAKTVADAHSVLHSVYKWAGNKAQGIADIDPCLESVLPKRKKNVAKGLRPTEWEILHAAARSVDEDAADLLLFLVTSGWRWSESVAIRSIDIDDFGVDGLWVTMGRVLRRGAQGRFVFVEDEAKSQAGMRRIKMSPEGAEMIRRRNRGLESNDLVFTNRQGRMWYYTGFFNRYWTRPVGHRDAAPNRIRILEAAAALGLTRHVEPYMLRHTHATLLILQGESLAAVQKRMGHEDVRTTINVYGSLVSDVSDESLKGLDSALSGRRTVSGLSALQ